MTAEKQNAHITDSTFASVVTNSELPVLVDFWAPWCGSCRSMGTTFAELAKEYDGRIKFVKVNVDEAQKTAMMHRIMNIPALILFTRGKPVDRQIGLQPKAILKQMIDRCLDECGETLPA